MIRSSLVSSVVVLLAMSPGAARAQYGYPGGYGGYGWGGWGSTLQGSIARGLGYFNMGRGAYNYDTSVARSINADTAIRWNEYMYQSHLEQTRRYHARLQADQPRHRLVEVEHPTLFIHHQHAILDRIEQRLQKTPLARQPVHHRLQPFRIQPRDAAQHFVEKTGFGGGH